ncbi:hypothetical protein [Paractinoplanes rishiriensis]|uniref:LSDAT prokaryote domain-containing protein n=1 Tax=Paractinoplanes rishiriensis TaxID=1050105 RepID=A0A919K299_9ACTN|nr:hypothetical protein [Actinoplanes rishiriensis]GIE99375.1 hypothetical protein Ari01nite_68400 [Actinoplanes rishiriensis]
MTVTVRLADGRAAVAVRPQTPADLPGAVAALGLGAPLPVVAVVGGAAGIDEQTMDELFTLFTDVIAPVIRERGAVAVDGGTDSGVMRLLGRARAAGAPFPLVGVPALDTVHFPGHRGAHPGTAALEPHHSHFVLVPGAKWGDEAPWLAGVASALSTGRGGVTVLVNGGEITVEDARCSVAEGRPVLVLAGTGRTADKIAAAVADPASCRDSRIAELAKSAIVRVADVADRTAAAAQLRGSLAL